MDAEPVEIGIPGAFFDVGINAEEADLGSPIQVPGVALNSLPIVW